MLERQMTVFYTDDDEEDLEIFKEVTETISKVNLVTHSDGQNLLQALENPPPTPNVLFLDLNMPGINGFEVLQRIREKDQLRKFPIIIFTTSNDATLIEKGRMLGADYFITKSGNFPQLRKSIEYALSIDWNTFSRSKENFTYSA